MSNISGGWVRVGESSPAKKDFLVVVKNIHTQHSPEESHENLPTCRSCCVICYFTHKLWNGS